MGHGSTPSATRESAYYAREQAKLAKKQYKWWQQMYQPTEQELLTQLRKPVQEQSYFKGLIGDVERQYGNAGANIRRNLAGRYQYGSGYEGAAQRNLGLSKATARAGAWQAGEQARQGGLMNMINLGRGSVSAAQQGYAGATQGFGSAGAVQSQRDIAKMQGITSGAQSGMQCLCRKFIAGRELTENVVKFRDMFFEKGSFIDLGYKLDSEISVPLMKNKVAKFLVKWLCLKPLGAYADFFFGENRYGFLLSPIGFFWIGLWVVTGATVARFVDLSDSELKFQKEVAQCLAS